MVEVSSQRIVVPFGECMPIILQKNHYNSQVSPKSDEEPAQNSELPNDPGSASLRYRRKTQHFSRPVRGSKEPDTRSRRGTSPTTYRARAARPGRGGDDCPRGEALIHRHVGERREPLGDEAQHLVGALPGRREPHGAAGGALQSVPAAADERAGVEVALAAADAADHIFEELVGERRVDEVGAPHRRRGGDDARPPGDQDRNGIGEAVGEGVE